ncbi:MAG: nucleoside hydrolase [Acidimicrobiales bacterium]
MTTPPAILLDCDPGIDDAVAILTAAEHGRLVGITTVAGNVGVDHTTRNALLTLQIAGLDLDVHSGAAAPLVAPARHATRIHGAAGFGTAELPELRRRAAPGEAATYICDMARSTTDLHLVAIGPLTNIALALRLDPDLPRRLAGITIMGGAATGGNVTAAAEFNVWADPEAAAVVFRDAAPITMVGLDLTTTVCLTETEIDRMRSAGSTCSALVADLLDYYLQRQREWGRPTAAVHDPCAVISVTHPHLFERGRHTVDVELSGVHTRGMTVVDRRPLEHEGTPTEVVWSADAAAVVELVVTAVAAA